MGKALYRKYRSKSLDEIVGQSQVTDILKRALAAGNVAHAYLLTGPRGVGKTSIARILAHQINELPYTDESTHLDIIEIDAASNNSVEDIRDLREKVMVAPSMARKKIYIIDEVHMLSKSAFNALLKTLEEPPEHVVFILATTDADKLPATILSRVQRFNFRTISEDDLVAHLRTIANAEGIDIDDTALALIARHGNGSFRDSISLLDQLRDASADTISREQVETLLGLATNDTIDQLLAAYQEGDLQAIVAVLDELEARGTPAAVITSQLIHAIHERVSSQPGLLTLLAQLLEIERSSWPHVKLLVALTDGLDAAPTAAQPTAPAAATDTATPIPTAKKQPKPEAAEATSEPKAGKIEAAKQEFKWSDFLRLVKEKSTGAHSILMKSSHGFDGETLTIYAGKKFPKAQLDKAMPVLMAALQTLGLSHVHITTLAHTKPPEDSQTAQILDIMGGGEEVQL